ncbi:MAG: serine hydrolase, partial [Pirellulaceae bacterium]|nr:serine hydrolase [Pirellulaceae bacterium]
EGKMIINPQFEWTGGGYASTAADLARWAKAFYEGKAFDAALLPQVLDGVEAPMLGRGAKYGLGTMIRNTAGKVTYGHGGFFPGYMTEMIYHPESRIAVAVQVNSSVPKALGRPLVRVALDVLELAGAP